MNPSRSSSKSSAGSTDLTSDELELLARLLASPEGIRFRADAKATGASAQFEACLRKLSELGCGISRQGVGEARLDRAPLPVWKDYLEFASREAGSPRNVRVYSKIGSTQDAVRDGADPRGLVLADEQTAGRGRLGRSWVAAPGSSVLMSVAHAARSKNESPDRIQCITAVAVAQALERLTGKRMIQIKWPNDLIVDGRKLSGILIETAPAPTGRLAVIGIGVNVDASQHPTELRGRVIGLRELGCPFRRLHVAAEVLAQLDGHLASSDSALLDEWRARNLMRSQRATFRSNGHRITGEVVDLDADAGLIVRTDSGQLVHLNAATTTVG